MSKFNLKKYVNSCTGKELIDNFNKYGYFSPYSPLHVSSETKIAQSILNNGYGYDLDVVRQFGSAFEPRRIQELGGGRPEGTIVTAKGKDGKFYDLTVGRDDHDRGIISTIAPSQQTMEGINLQSSSKKMKKIAGRKRIKDRGIDWKEHYHERSVKLKKRFEKDIGPGVYKRWEGHDYSTNGDYFIVVGPALTREGKKRFFSGIKRLPEDPKAKVYAPSGEYFTTISGAFSHASEKWAVKYPKEVQRYTINDLANVKIPRHVKG